LLGFSWDGRLIAWGGLITVLAMLLYGVNIFGTLIRKREWNPFVLGIGLSVISFICTGLYGTLLGLHLGQGIQWLAYDYLFGSHLWLGIGGWLSGLIFIFSFKL